MAYKSHGGGYRGMTPKGTGPSLSSPKQGAGHRSASNPSGKGSMPARKPLGNLPRGKKG